MIIKLNKIKKLSENDENWHIYENENFIELMFERQNWLKDFLYNFSLIIMTGLYEKEQL